MVQPQNLQSHPVWVCVLKHPFAFFGVGNMVSHPVWVCVLKHQYGDAFKPVGRVTPCMGVCIETTKLYCKSLELKGHTLYGCVY